MSLPALSAIAAVPRTDLDVNRRAYDIGRLEERLAAARSRLPAEPDRPRSASFTASAQIIDMTSPRDQARVRKATANRAAQWESEAWRYFDDLPEIKAGARFKARTMSKLGLYPAVIVDPDSDPVSLDTPIDDAGTPVIEDLAVIQACNQALTRLGSGKGGISSILERWGGNGFVTGQGYLIGYADPTNLVTGETFGFYSTDELRINDRGRWAIAESPDAKPDEWVVLPETDTVVVRIWNQHYRYSQMPDSSVRGVLDLCENLLFLQNMGLGTAMARMNAGILFLPTGMLKNKQPVDGDGTHGESLRDPVVQDILDHIMTPIGNPRSAAVAAPVIITADPDDIEKVKHLSFSREFDAIADAREKDLIIRLANGVDLPAEVLLGMAASNHWSAWLIDDQTFRSYIQPDVNEFVNAVTMGYYQPALLAAGMAPDLVRRMCLWYDRTDLVGDPDEGDRVFKAVEAGLVGDQPARRRLGFSEAEAPTDEDIARRVLLHGRAPAAADVAADVAVTDATGPGAIPATDPNAQQADVITAAAARDRRKKLAAMSARWTARDAAVMNRTLGQADTAMSRALDRAGAKLRTMAAKAGPSLAASLDGVRNREVAARLGEHVVTASLDVGTDTLLEGSFDELAYRYRIQLARAQAATLNDLRDLGLDESDCEEVAAQQEDDRNKAAALLLAGLLALASKRLFATNVTAEPANMIGEIDAHLSVPASLVRYTNSVAGGAPADATQTPGGAVLVPAPGTPGGPASRPGKGMATTPTGGSSAPSATDGREPAGGVTGGPTVSEPLTKLGIVTNAFVWVYGDPSDRTRNFEPHAELDGVEFADWTSPEIANTDSWPEFGYFFPGDHDGCLCDVERVLADDGQSDTGDEG